MGWTPFSNAAKLFTIYATGICVFVNGVDLARLPKQSVHPSCVCQHEWTAFGTGPCYMCPRHACVSSAHLILSLVNWCVPVGGIECPTAVNHTEGGLSGVFVRCNPDDYSSCGDGAVPDDTQNRAVSIAQPASAVAAHAYENCTDIRRVIFPVSMRRIGYRAFWQAYNLEEVNFNVGLETIDVGAFHSCSSLRVLNLPESTVNIFQNAFRHCSDLQSVTLPSALSEVGLGVFEGCISLTSISIPSNVTSIKNHSFFGCSSLVTVSIPASVTRIGQFAFYGCSNLSEFTPPASGNLTVVDDGAFHYCKNLSRATFPNTTVFIGRASFANTSIQRLSIPASVTVVGQSAFQNCTDLQRVDIANTSIIIISRHSFANCPNLVSARVPARMVSGSPFDPFLGHGCAPTLRFYPTVPSNRGVVVCECQEVCYSCFDICNSTFTPTQEPFATEPTPAPTPVPTTYPTSFPTSSPTSARMSTGTLSPTLSHSVVPTLPTTRSTVATVATVASSTRPRTESPTLGPITHEPTINPSSNLSPASPDSTTDMSNSFSIPSSSIRSSSTISTQSPDSSSSVSESSNDSLITVGVCLSLILVAAVLFLVLRRRQRNHTDNLRGLLVKARQELMEKAKTTFYKLYGINVSFIGTEKFESSFKELLVADTSLIERNSISRGPFGVVFQGSLLKNASSSAVAAKFCHAGDAAGNARLIVEARLLHLLNHKAIIKLEAAHIQSTRPWLCTLLQPNGDLKSYLKHIRKNQEDGKPSWTDANAVIVARVVCGALEYITEQGVIHGDVAARNILVGSSPPTEVYLSDFGAAVPRSVGSIVEDKYSANATLPFRWMPPESLLESELSHKSDVWAFGVMIWELLSFGKTPYGALGYHEVKGLIISGKRLSAPDCNPQLFRLAESCWAIQPSERPSFQQLHSQLCNLDKGTDAIIDGQAHSDSLLADNPRVSFSQSPVVEDVRSIVLNPSFDKGGINESTIL